MWSKSEDAHSYGSRSPRSSSPCSCQFAPADCPRLCLWQLGLGSAWVRSLVYHRVNTRRPSYRMTGVAGQQLAVVSETKAIIYDKVHTLCWLPRYIVEDKPRSSTTPSRMEGAISRGPLNMI